MRTFFLFLCVCCTNLNSQTAQAQSQPAFDYMQLIQSKWAETLSQLSEGEMDFHIVMPSPLESVDYQGVVSWRHPSIRWDFEQSFKRESGTVSAAYTIIDSPKEVITHNRGTYQVFRSWERCRTYSSELRLAPWQCWFEYDGQVSWNVTLDPQKFRDDSSRSVSATSSGNRVEILIDSSTGGLTIDFDGDSGRLLQYKSHRKGQSEGRVLRAGKFEWTEIEGVPFLSKMSLWTSSPDENLPSTPRLTVEMSNHKLASRWSDNEFRYSGLDKSLIDVATEYFPDNREPVKRVLRNRKLNDVDALRKLGESISNIGFAAGPN